MGWQDDEVIDGGGWQNDPVVGEAKQAAAPKAPSMGAKLMSAAVRPAAQLAAGLPLMAMDAGVGTRNFLTGSKYQLPSDMFSKALDSYTLPPEGLGKVAELVSASLLGSRLPTPQAAQQAVKGFMPPAQALRTQTLQRAQQEGYVVPPSANNPTVANSIIEGIAGKDRINKEALMRNDQTTARLAARALGQNEQAPLTQDALRTIRNEASKSGYEPLRSLGKITADNQFQNAVQNVTQLARGAERMGVKSPSEIDGIVEALGKNKEFDSADAVDTISYLRDKADDAYRGGKASDGKAYKTLAKALEDQIERHLTSQGEQGAQALKNFRDARTLMAKTYTAGKALVEDSGLSKARVYAAELGREKPLEGDQRTIAGFGSAFGKYVSATPNAENFPALSPVDVYGSAIAAGAADSALPLMYPLTRRGLRNYMLSPSGQARALPKAYKPQDTMGLLGSFPMMSQYASQLLRQ